MHDVWLILGIISVGVMWWFLRAFFAFTIFALRHTLAVHEATMFGWEG